MNRVAAILLIAVLLVSAVAIPVRAEESDPSGDAMLIDMGNGTTYWVDLEDASGTYSDLVASAADALGLDCEVSDGTVVTLGEMTVHDVGGQTCYWILYLWDGSGWTASDSTAYDGGSFAWGFYPDPTIVPAETPDSRTAWTQHRGDSSSSGNSGSYGTVDAKSPMEWYRTYSTGFVDSSIIIAGDYLYHTTGGTYGASGSDRNPWVYCLDRFTGDIIWDFMMAYGAGYEVTSPLIVGDMLIVTATNYNVYCFDRFTGDIIDTLTLESDVPLDDNGDAAWEGRSFYTGGTTPIYDSGAVYFGTANGHVLAYSVTRADGFTLLWDYDPDDTFADGVYTGVKGCFYYHAPVIADVNGTRMLFIGSYEGYVYALDASTGAEIWVERMIDLDGDNIPHPGTPGSAGAISIMPDGKLLINCTDGGMSPQTGYTVCVDASTGRGPDGSDWYWKLDVLMGGPVVTDDAIFAYVQTSASGASTLTLEDGSEMDIIDAVYRLNLDGEVIWVCEESASYGLIKASATLADGVIYIADYSSGEYWPSGGGVTAISAEDGSEIWRLKLSPSSKDSYNMVAVTVIDGKLYVGNDYGAVYCISEVAGPQVGDDGEIVLENGFYHWSWYLLIAVAVLAIVVFWRLYRGFHMNDSEKLSLWRRGYRGLKEQMEEPPPEDESEISRKKRRFVVIVAFGIVMSFVAFLISISISSGGVISVSEAISSLFSAVGKALADPDEVALNPSAYEMNTLELFIYESRLPRTIAAIAVGAGLAVAGCMYQAIIRNPLVDPYITGVSSGAGCFAIAVVALGITIPMIPNSSLYIIPVAAIIGGLLAFAITMIVAEGAGGSAVNYILAGTIVGFAFSSVQTIFLTLSLDNIENTMWWLYGSFANVSWENAWLVFVPAMGLSLISMIWAREYNLFMMGEEQAKQLGLNVKLFKRLMLILASVLTAVCVAFCGIIGFVGLIIPHACRMALGSDYRLVMPASIVLGAMLMLFADLIARTVLSPQELPVGAITAMIGTPIFAYMLMRKGRQYDG